MAIAYEIATKISLENAVSPVLALISKEFLGLQGTVNSVEKSLESVRGKMAILGGVGIAGGLALAAGLKAMADHAKDLSHELVQIKKLNITPEQLGQVRGAAVDVLHQVPGTSEVDALKTYGASYSMFGHEGAITLMKSLSEFAQVSGNTSGDYEKAANNVYSMVRAGDLMGKFVNESTHQVDPEKLKGFLDLGSKVILGTHGKVDANAWFQLAQMGGPALAQMSEKGLLTMAIAAQAMGGSRAGTALTSLYQQMVGGKMTENAAKHLHDLGLVGDYTVGKGGHLLWGKGALDTPLVKSLKDDPMNAVQLIKDQMEKHGFDSIEKQIPELFQILGRQTTQRLIHDLLRNMPQIMAERERIAGSLDTSESAKLQNSEDYEQVQHNMGEAWKNLMYAVAGPNSENAIAVMSKITDAFNSMSDTVRGMDPEVLKGIGVGLAALSAALVVGGAATLFAALSPAGWLVGGITALGLALAALWPKVEKAKSISNAEASNQLEHPLRAFPDPSVGPPGGGRSAIPPGIREIGSFFQGLPGMFMHGIERFKAAVPGWHIAVEAAASRFGKWFVDGIKNAVGPTNWKNALPDAFWHDLEKIKEGFRSIPGAVDAAATEIGNIGQKIRDAVSSIPGMVGNAASEMAAAIGAKISAAVRSIPDYIGSLFGHKPAGPAGPATPAPEKHSRFVPHGGSDRPIVLHAKLEANGRQLAQVVASNIVREHRAVNSSNGFDGGAHWAGTDVG